jgi:23S rRNA (adenine2503-C2)-methyltransferase
MTDLSLDLRQQLKQNFIVSTPTIEKRQRSTDSTEKLLIRLNDGQLIESVFIPDTPRQAFCVSTQVGCAMRCGFCLTGKMNLARNLTAGEIVGQVRRLAHTLGLAETSFNVVFMGMGEPLHNYDATMKALRILTAESGFAMPPRRITLSTVGIPAGLTRLAKEAVLPNIAVSLHAATEELREQLVPANRTYSLTDVVAACREFPVTRHRRITFEYVMLAGINDSVSDARRLAALLRGIQAKINLIPLNEAPGIPFQRPTDSQIDRFARTLAHQGAVVSIRKSRGRDIRAACGQLAIDGNATDAS